MKTPKRVVVIGNGMAGARAVRELRRRDPAIAITVLGAERCAPYNRILLTDVLAARSTRTTSSTARRTSAVPRCTPG